MNVFGNNGCSTGICLRKQEVESDPYILHFDLYTTTIDAFCQFTVVQIQILPNEPNAIGPTSLS